MGIELGRISGPLLARNLVRKNAGSGEENLAFHNTALTDNILYIDVINDRIGINTDSPSQKLEVNGTKQTTNLLVPTQLETPNLVFSTDRIQNIVSALYLQPDQSTDPKIVATKFGTLNLRISDKLIENITNDSDINFSPNGTGTTVISTDELRVNGDLHATGDITFDGTIIFGDSNSDNVTFSSDVNSHIVPNLNQTYDLGTSLQRWNNLYTTNFKAESLNLSSLTVNDVNLLLTQGNTLYVSVNGNDTTGTGRHLQSTYKTVAKALSVATAGDNIYIYPGTYLEILPLTVPTGVSVTGAGLRSVTIKPATGYETQDVFKLNGETTISNLTVSGYSVGSAFSFASNITVSTRSPYVFNVTVIPETYPTLSAVAPYHNMGNPSRTPRGFEFNIDGTVMYVITTTSILAFNLPSPYYYQYVTATTTPDSTYTLTSNIYSKITFKPDGTRLYISEQNKLRQFSLSTPWDITTLSLMGDVTVSGLGDIQFSTDGTTLFARATAGLRVYQLSSAWDITAGLSLTTITFSPFTICSGFYFDSTGSTLYVVSSSSLIKVFALTTPWSLSSYSLLKIITGNSNSVSPSIPVSFKVINGLFYTLGNGFMYVGQETVASGNGALVDGSLATNSSKEASMLFHSVTMIVPGSVGVHATNGARVEWLNSFSYYADKGIYLTQGTSGFANLGTQFGAELRSINSANIYGTYGAVADGPNCIAYLIGHNFAYIGTGLDSNNDPKLVIQANEVVELNSGRIFYESVDHRGDFRLGEIFQVNQDTGAVTFNAQSISFTPTGNITLSGPSSNAYVDYSMVQVGNINIHNNNIDSLFGPVNFLANSGTTYLNTDVFVTGNTNVSADILVHGNLDLGNQSTDTVTFFSNITQDLLPDNVGGPFELGSSTKRWQTLYGTLLNVDNVTEISNNTISILTSNTDLELIAAGTGLVKSLTSDVLIDTTLTINGTPTFNGTSNFQNIENIGTITQTGNVIQTGDLYVTGNVQSANVLINSPSWIESQEFKLKDTTISVTSTNSDLILSANGAGGINLDNYVKFKNNTISNIFTGDSPVGAGEDTIIAEDGSVLLLEDGITTFLTNWVDTHSLSFDPNGTGNLVINSTKSLKVPLGNTSNRVLSINGEIRYNTTYNIFEGFQETNIISFNDVSDVDRNTHVQAGAADNTLYFTTNGTQKATITSTRLYTDNYFVDNVQLTSNTINNRINDRDLIFAPNGTGDTVLNNLPIGNGGNTITNPLNSALILQSTGTGYIKFNGSSGLVIPVGNTSERRATPEVGELRYNAEKGLTEVFSGDVLLGESGWIPAIGTSGEISAEDVTDLLELYTLVLG